jgi:hypothetical protein
MRQGVRPGSSPVCVEVEALCGVTRALCHRPVPGTGGEIVSPQVGGGGSDESARRGSSGNGLETYPPADVRLI